jgi:tRNA 2-selenouridine synthase
MWRKMRNSVLYHMEVDREVRLDRIMKYYSEPLDHAVLRESFEKIQQRLGGLEYKQAIQALDANDLRTAAGIALQYYDKSYEFQMSKWPSEKVVRIEGCNDPREAAEKLLISKTTPVIEINR